MHQISCGEGRFQVTVSAIKTDEGIAVIITGGSKSHVGAVVLSSPRPSLTGEGASCDSWIIPLPGHKDDIIAKELAETLCRQLQVPVSVTAGVHIDNADNNELKLLCKNCLNAGEQLLSLLSQ